MVDADVDIYGDLCDDKPAPLLEQLPPVLALAPVAVPPAAREPPPPATAPPPAASPPPAGASPPPRSGAENGGEWPPQQEWAPPPAWEEWDYSEGIVADNGEAFKPGEEDANASGQSGHAEPEKPEDFESLQKELLADEAASGKKKLVRKASTVGASTEGAPSGSDTEPDAASEISAGEEGEEALVPIEEIRASERQAIIFPRRWGGRPPAARGVGGGALGGEGGSGGSGRFRKKEVAVFIGPPPPAPSGGAGAESLLLVGGLPWWLSDAELRRHAEQFGQVRAIRMLDHPSTGKSLGVALVEYLTAEAVRKAAAPGEGLGSLSAWASMREARPRVVLVSHELFCRLRAGQVPWPEGGPCAEELRTILLRQFDLSHLAGASGASRGGRPPTGSPSRALQRAASGASLAGRGASPELDRSRKDEGWADKLKKLQANVNRRQSSSEQLSDPQPHKRRR